MTWETYRDQRLRIPRRRQSEDTANQSLAEQGRATPACAQSERVCGQQQVLDGGGDALNRHGVLGLSAGPVRIPIHIVHAQTRQDEKWGRGKPSRREPQFCLNDLLIESGGAHVPLPPPGHRGRQPLSETAAVEDDEAPGLRVVTGGSLNRSVQEDPHRVLGNGVGLVEPDRAPATKNPPEIVRGRIVQSPRRSARAARR